MKILSALTLLLLAVALYAFAEEGPQSKSKIEVTATLPPDAPELSEALLIKTVGLPVVKRYRLDDGHGLSFRKDVKLHKSNGSIPAPDFKLEIRANHFNVAWYDWGYQGIPETIGYEELSKENWRLAEKVFTVAFGMDLAKQIIDYARRRQPATIKTSRYEIYASVGGSESKQYLVTTYFVFGAPW